MPVISMFYGIIVSLYFQDNRQHHRPHIHAKYQGDEAVIAIPDGELLDGYLPPGKMKNSACLGGNTQGRPDGGLGACGQRSAAV